MSFNVFVYYIRFRFRLEIAKSVLLRLQTRAGSMSIFLVDVGFRFFSFFKSRCRFQFFQLSRYRCRFWFL